MFLRAKCLLLFAIKEMRNTSDNAKLQEEQAGKYISDEMIGKWAKHRGLICLHSSVRSTERNRAEHFCTAQQSAFLHWLRPAGALLCRDPISTFHICAPRGWMGLPSQAGHLWEGFLCGRGRLSKPFPCLDASCNGYFFKHSQIKLFEFLCHSSSLSAPSASNNKWGKMQNLLHFLSPLFLVKKYKLHMQTAATEMESGPHTDVALNLSRNVEMKTKPLGRIKKNKIITRSRQLHETLKLFSIGSTNNDYLAWLDL